MGVYESERGDSLRKRDKTLQRFEGSFQDGWSREATVAEPREKYMEMTDTHWGRDQGEGIVDFQTHWIRGYRIKVSVISG